MPSCQPTWVLDVNPGWILGASSAGAEESLILWLLVWCDVEKGKVSARRGESELGNTQGKIWGQCEVLSVP